MHYTGLLTGLTLGACVLTGCSSSNNSTLSSFLWSDVSPAATNTPRNMRLANQGRTAQNQAQRAQMSTARTPDSLNQSASARTFVSADVAAQAHVPQRLAQTAGSPVAPAAPHAAVAAVPQAAPPSDVITASPVPATPVPAPPSPVQQVADAPIQAIESDLPETVTASNAATSAITPSLPAFNARSYVGRPASSIISTFGPPASRTQVGAGERWIYNSNGCRLNVLIFPEARTGQQRVTHADLQPGAGSSVQACTEQLHLRR